MADYTEIAKRLREDKSWIEQGTTETEHEIAEHIQQAADAIKELDAKVIKWQEEACHWNNEYYYLLDSMPCWIPVTERLPEAYEEVLIYLWDNPSAYIAWVDQAGQWETNDFYVGKDYLPKAWMPLPKPPKEE